MEGVGGETRPSDCLHRQTDPCMWAGRTRRLIDNTLNEHTQWQSDVVPVASVLCCLSAPCASTPSVSTVTWSHAMVEADRAWTRDTKHTNTPRSRLTHSLIAQKCTLPPHSHCLSGRMSHPPTDYPSLCQSTDTHRDALIPIHTHPKALASQALSLYTQHTAGLRPSHISADGRQCIHCNQGR